eukprot:13632302-Heterocapsa_arctica.AAC.1
MLPVVLGGAAGGAGWCWMMLPMVRGDAAGVLGGAVVMLGCSLVKLPVVLPVMLSVLLGGARLCAGGVCCAAGDVGLCWVVLP